MYTNCFQCRFAFFSFRHFHFEYSQNNTNTTFLLIQNAIRLLINAIQQKTSLRFATNFFFKTIPQQSVNSAGRTCPQILKGTKFRLDNLFSLKTDPVSGYFRSFQKRKRKSLISIRDRA